MLDLPFHQKKCKQSKNNKQAYFCRTNENEVVVIIDRPAASEHALLDLDLDLDFVEQIMRWVYMAPIIEHVTR